MTTARRFAALAATAVASMLLLAGSVGPATSAAPLAPTAPVVA